MKRCNAMLICLIVVIVALLSLYGFVRVSDADSEALMPTPSETPDVPVVILEIICTPTLAPIITPAPTAAPTAIPSDGLTLSENDEEAATVIAKCLYRYETKSYTEKVGVGEVIVLRGLTAWSGVNSIVGAAKYHDEFRYSHGSKVTDRNYAIAVEAICRVRYYFLLINSGEDHSAAERIAGLVVPGDARYAWESSSMRASGSYDYTVHIQTYDDGINGPSGTDWDWSFPNDYEN